MDRTRQHRVERKGDVIEDRRHDCDKGTRKRVAMRWERRGHARAGGDERA